MKKYIQKLILGLTLAATAVSCADTNYPGGEISPYIGIYDVRNLYKGTAVPLNLETLEGSSKITGLVVSDHSAGNLPPGLLVVQDSRRLNFLRGISINLGNDAAQYQPGDSIVVDLSGASLERVDGILQISGLSTSQIQRVASGRPIAPNRVTIDLILANPNNYESTLVSIVKGGFPYAPTPGQILSGEQQINDGFGQLALMTESSSPVAQLPQHKMANYTGIIFSTLEGDSLVPHQRLRNVEDLVQLTSEYRTPKVIITGWSNDPRGTDANNEYIQFMATEDIDFSVTPFSVVTTNNANASTPTGFPQKGWATGGVRTYKFDLTSGFAAKGTLFYIGGSNKLIMSTGSTSIAHANWILAYAYNTNDGFGFGNRTTNLLANSGNAYGAAIFQGTDIDVNSIPEDVMFFATGGSLVGNGFGYRITNTDYYDIINPLTLEEQPFYRSGTNTKSMTYNTPSDAGYFNYFGGEFNMTLGRWTKARAKYAPILEKTSTLEEIEDPEFLTKLVY